MLRQPETAPRPGEQLTNDERQLFSSYREELTDLQEGRRDAPYTQALEALAQLETSVQQPDSLDLRLFRGLRQMVGTHQKDGYADNEILDKLARVAQKSRHAGVLVDEATRLESPEQENVTADEITYAMAKVFAARGDEFPYNFGVKPE